MVNERRVIQHVRKQRIVHIKSAKKRKGQHRAPWNNVRVGSPDPGIVKNPLMTFASPKSQLELALSIRRLSQWQMENSIFIFYPEFRTVKKKRKEKNYFQSWVT